MKHLSFTIYMRPEPQGSSRAFVIPGTNRAVVTTDNKKLKPFRSELTRMALAELDGVEAPMFAKGTAVKVFATFRFQRPASAKARIAPVVKPDLDKLVRAVLDSLTGVAFHDDAQVVEVVTRKEYGPVDMVIVGVSAA